MVDKKEILKELEKKFEDLQKEIGLSLTLDEIDEEFSIRDSVLHDEFVSENFSRQLASRIGEHFRDWHGYLNNLLIPNPSYYAGQTESKLFSKEEDKKLIWNLITISMKYSSMQTVAGLTRDKALMKEYLESSYKNWKEIFKPGLIAIMKRVHEGWKAE